MPARNALYSARLDPIEEVLTAIPGQTARLHLAIRKHLPRVAIVPNLPPTAEGGNSGWCAYIAQAAAAVIHEELSTSPGPVE